MIKGAILGVIQLALLLGIGGKLLVDGATLPRVWIRTTPYDPNLPIRGRYVSLQISAEARDFKPGVVYQGARFSVDGEKLLAYPANDSSAVMVLVNGPVASVSQPVAFFIPEKIPDPSRRERGEELWMEVTVPRKGPVRPLRLGVKKDGVLTPLAID